MLVVTMSEQIPGRLWANEPERWTETKDALTLTVPAGTDYWRITHYGFIHDNGPFRYQQQSGNFEAKVRVAGQYAELYHHAGLMIRIDDLYWIKTGIEYLNGKKTVSAVVTREFSDWSVRTLESSPAHLWLRVQRYHDTVQVAYSLDEQPGNWTMIRLAYFPPQVPVSIGMFAGAPGKQEFDLTFADFSIDALDHPPVED